MATIKEVIGQVMAPVMTGKSRLMVMASLPQHIQRLAGVKSELMYEDADVNTEITLLGAEYFKTYPTFSWDVYNFEADALGQPRVTAEYGLPDIDYSNPIIRGEEDLYKLKWPTENPLDAGRYPLYLKQIEVVNRYYPYRLASFPAVSSFTLACELCTFPGFMRMIKRQPELAHEIMRRIVVDVHAPLVKAVAERFPGISFCFADAWEMIPNISPKVQREFVWKYYDLLREETKGVNANVAWYMTYGEGSMPDPAAYLMDKVKYSGGLTTTHTENVPDEVYRKLAIEHNLPLNVQIPATTILSGPDSAIIDYVKTTVKQTRLGVPDQKYTLIALCPASASSYHLKVTQAVGEALSAIPCPTSEEIDAMQITVPAFEETFEEFCRRKAKGNPDGYTFKWLDQAKFQG